MSTPFQNRLVGTIIVAAALIIFLPDILDGEKESYQADFEAIPQAPKFEGAIAHKAFPEEKLAAIPKSDISDEEPIDDQLATMATAGTANSEQAINGNESDLSTSQVSKNNTTVATPAKKEAKIAMNASTVSKATPKLPPVKKDQYAWVIHLGSFKHKKNVDDLMAKLKGAGYTAFTQPIKTQKGTLTKVIIGPNLHKAELEKAIPKLKSLTSVQGRIAKFKVTK
ncbi:SPOR domain-containing protein [Thalassotalea euphylliae]|uniref:DedD protein n=1 Tax=Thalassotalea euphylliae TaxID=1655234 RepID=A0A3E0UAE0_9GAMM|nr:SPOR domain-containing protein [Thalassotalea euphylliae]REL32782.1 dedD protein [Thalassotalea euphylliae]